MSIRILLVFAITFVSAFRPAESRKEITELIENLSKANAQKKNIAYDLTYKLYADANSQTVLSTLNGLLIQRNGDKYSQLGEIESLKTSKYFISIDREEKMMMLSDNNGGGNQGFDLEQLKKYLDLCKEYNITKTSANQSKLRLELKAGEINQLDVFYNTTSYSVEKICMFYNKAINSEYTNNTDASNQRLEILFKEKEYAMSEDSRLTLANYCTIKNGVWKPSIKYPGYEFINNLNKK
ncbi:MAG: hypothetical protein Q8M15_03310 [Bacteroidota bacterium]|nr:hypothetical protein [Bacteroidota bacterium]